MKENEILALFKQWDDAIQTQKAKDVGFYTTKTPYFYRQ